jgi:3-hydroxyacyl-CoA dehydrogenase/enoyl-CoA hydratase/3-hydroxybutyryl-CoA epimerase
MVNGRTKGVYPAAKALLSAVYEGAMVPFDTALKIEARWFTHVLMNPSSANMIRSLFVNKDALEKGANRPEVPDQTVRKVGVLGAGMMGAGITLVAAMAGIEVVLVDQSAEAAEKGKAHTADYMDKGIKRGKATAEKKQAALERITATDDYAALAGCDLIIEAVFERIDVKEAVLKEHEALLSDHGIWGSNTSTLPISRLAEGAAKPEKFIGLHFFSPVDKMPLLEIVVGDKTDDETLARAFDFARQIGKTPIVVNDSTGFYTSRTIGTKMDEAVQMVAEGLDPVLVENLSRAVGFPTGMLTLYDEVKLSLAIDIFDTQQDMGLRRAEDDPTPEARGLLRALVEAGRKGRGTGGGFFDHTEAGKDPWPGLAQWRKDGAKIPPEDIKDRMLFRAVLETLRCLDEGVLRSAPDANIGAIMGIGAPAWTGGYAQFVETYGRERFIARCEELAMKYGDRFQPPASLRKAA